MERPENQQQKGQPSARPGEQKDRSDKANRTPGQATDSTNRDATKRDYDAE